MNYDKKLLDEVIEIAVAAGKEIMEIYSRDFSVDYKDDKSPLTEADTHSNNVICDGLEKLNKQFPILSEENKKVTYEERKDWKTFWCVDPIDGTKEFIKKNGEFTVNIALIEDGAPVMGVVYAPALDTCYYGMKDFGAFKDIDGKTVKLPENVNDYTDSKVINVVASRSHLNEETEQFINALDSKYADCEIDKVSKGSSLKLCMVAEGTADVYPRVAPTMEWDTAAAQGVVEAAGKKVFIFESVDVDKMTINGENNFKPLVYNKEDLLNPYFVVV